MSPQGDARRLHQGRAECENGATCKDGPDRCANTCYPALTLSSDLPEGGLW